MNGLLNPGTNLSKSQLVVNGQIPLFGIFARHGMGVDAGLCRLEDATVDLWTVV